MQKQISKESSNKQKTMFMYDVEPLDVLKPIDVQETELSSVDLESIAIIYDKIR